MEKDVNILISILENGILKVKPTPNVMNFIENLKNSNDKEEKIKISYRVSDTDYNKIKESLKQQVTELRIIYEK